MHCFWTDFICLGWNMYCQLPNYTSHVHVLTYLYSPGMNAEDDVDDKVIECCSDADVFVYVANGTATFETSVSSSVCRYIDNTSM